MPRPRHVARNAAIWADHVKGVSQLALAEKYGICQQRVSAIIAEVRRDLPEETRTELVQRDVALLYQLRAELVDLWNAAPMPVLFQGQEVVTADGEKLVDHAGRLKALDALLKIMDRSSKLLGLDAAKRVQAEVTAPQLAPAIAARVEAARLAIAQQEAAITAGDDEIG